MPEFASYESALRYYRGHRPGYFTNRTNGGQQENAAALREYVTHKIETGEIRIREPDFGQAASMFGATL